MNFLPDNVYHIFNQGNNHQAIFSCDEEYEIFLRLVRENIFAHSEIISWCLMPNHFHLMVYTDERVLNIKKQGGLQIDDLTNGIRKLLSGYARIYNQGIVNQAHYFVKRQNPNVCRIALLNTTKTSMIIILIVSTTFIRTLM